MDAKEYLHEVLNEWDTVFDPPVKCEYTEEQLLRFAELWAVKKQLELIDKLSKDLIK